MIQSVSLNFQSLDQMRDFLQDQLNSADLSLQLPPFLTSFYHPLRKRLYQGFRPLHEGTYLEKNAQLYKFIQIVDEETLSLYQLQLSKPYQDLIMVKHYGIPNTMNVDQLKNDNQTLLALTTLVSSIAEWNIQIELVVDALARVQLYGLWAPEKQQLIKETQLNAELKSLLAPNTDFDFKLYTKHIMLNLLSQGAEKFGKFLYSNGIQESNLSYGAVLLIYHSLVGKQALPWNVILPSVSLKWLFGGLLGSLALGKIASYLDKYDQIEQVYSCATIFKEITRSLVEFNEKLTATINECLLTVSEADGQAKRNVLAKTIADFLEQPDSITFVPELITSEDLLKHHEQEWQIIQ